MKFKRIVSLMVAVAAVLAMVIPVHGEESVAYNYTDPYVIIYEGSESLLGYEAYSKPFLYASPHRTAMSIRDLESGRMISYSCAQKIYNMIDTTRLSQGGEGAYASLEVYCADACINANGGSSYRRINLEDSTYFSKEIAGRLRAIYFNSFPYIKDMQRLTDQVNAYLDALGTDHEDVSDLTAAEVVTATQYTIWILANGSDVVAEDAYTYTDPDYTAEKLKEKVVYVTNAYMDCTEPERETTDNNIRMVQQYLQSLPAMAPQKPVASEMVLTAAVSENKQEADGSYTLEVSYALNAAVTENDQLTLTLTCGGEQKTVCIDAEALTGRISLTGLDSVENGKLEVNGYQSGADVYLFDAADERGNSQTMIGYDSSYLPVHAEVSLETADHILAIHKSTAEDDGKRPLGNISFQLYRVATMEDVASGAVELSETPTQEELDRYQTQENLVATLTTGPSGYASFNFTKAGEPDGIYLVVELPNPAVTAPVTPFYVAIPGTGEDGATVINTVNVYPKNTTEAGPSLKKDVTEIENDRDTFGVGQPHTWILRGTIPSGMAEAVEYTLTDTLDYRLTYLGALRVAIAAEEEGAEQGEFLEQDVHYSLVHKQTEDAQGNTVDCISVSLTPEGRTAAAKAAAEKGPCEVRVIFDAYIDQDAQMGVPIPNCANLDYTNSLGVSYHTGSDVPVVYTGGVMVLKVDSAEKKPLSGATFEIWRKATEGELADETVDKQILSIGGEDCAVVPAWFYTTASLTGETVAAVTTDEEGKGLLYGLAWGEYYLVETKAPGGYNLLTAPVTVQIDASSHLEEAAVTVVNSKYSVPDTGGAGTAVFTLSGLGLIGLASILLLAGRKKRT